MILSAAPIILDYGYDDNISVNSGVVYTFDLLNFSNTPALLSAKDVTLNQDQLLILTNSIKLQDCFDPVFVPSPTPGSSPSPTPSITPTVTPTPSPSCTIYDVNAVFVGGDWEIDVSWTNCNGSSGNYTNANVAPFSYYIGCAQTGTVSVVIGSLSTGSPC